MVQNAIYNFVNGQLNCASSKEPPKNPFCENVDRLPKKFSRLEIEVYYTGNDEEIRDATDHARLERRKQNLKKLSPEAVTYKSKLTGHEAIAFPVPNDRW